MENSIDIPMYHFKYLGSATTENNNEAKEVAAQKFRRKLKAIMDL